MPNPESSAVPCLAPIALHWTCISNFEGDNVFAARLELRNISGADIAPGWTIYFNACRKLVDGSIDEGFAIDHVNGDLFRLTATRPAAWPAGHVHAVGYRGQFWAISMTDAPLGFYLIGANGAVTDLGDPAIAPYAQPAQRHRGLADCVALHDPAGRYRANEDLRLLAPERVGCITPRPLASVLGSGRCVPTCRTDVQAAPGLESEAALLRTVLATLPDTAAGCERVVLATGPVTGVPDSPEAYQMDIGARAIVVCGASAHGVFNAIQSLRQVLGPDGAPLGRISDAPRFAYRGLMLDVARHFASRDTVLRLLDCMALYKLNRFHFHLTDDEGWRFAVPALPELIEVGARRGIAADGGTCLPPSFGSGADVSRSAGSGHYSDDDFIAIVRYAHERHIEVIPEFNMPGHARAAIVAMRARHDRLLAQGDAAGADEYLLDDAADGSLYESVQLWHDNVICIALPSVERFIDTVVGALVDLFRRAGVPLHTIHTGGDEVPAGAWLASPACLERMAAQGWHDVAQLRADFYARCHAILARHGVAHAGWEETALERSDAGTQAGIVSPGRAMAGLRVYAWNNAWGSGLEDAAYRLANAGYEVVLANAASLYLDLAYAKNPREPGYYWAGFVDTRDTFGFCPLDAASGKAVNPMGQGVAPQTLAAMTPLDSAGAARIAGLQGQLWTENAPSCERIEYMAAPRMIALAERAWASDPQWQDIEEPPLRAAALARDWNEFANRLGQRVLPQLDAALGFGYRIPPPGVVVEGGALHANIALPGLPLHYTVDGSEPTPGSALYAGPLPCPAADVIVKIAAFDTRGRKSRTVTFASGTIADE
jgi:hexosaminidase